MPQLTKVKTRFWTPVVAICGVGIAGFIIAEQKSQPASVGELAVSDPRPPVIVPAILNRSTSSNTTLKVMLEPQRLLLLVDGEIAIDTPVTVGRKGRATPEGNFQIGGKIPELKQDEFGSFVDREGNIIIAGVYRHMDPIPTGLRFTPEPLKQVFTITGKKFKIHAGPVSNLPVSDGAIIIPPKIAHTLFTKVGIACPVEIVPE